MRVVLGGVRVRRWTVSDKTMREALRVLGRAARRGLPVLDWYGDKWVYEKPVWRNLLDGRKRTSYVLTKFTPLQLSTLREVEPLQVGGVTVPGQWLTPQYVAVRQAEAMSRLREPRMRTCGECGAVMLAVSRSHVCGVVGRDAVAAALPWRKEKAA